MLCLNSVADINFYTGVKLLMGNRVIMKPDYDTCLVTPWQWYSSHMASFNEQKFGTLLFTLF